MSLVSDIGGGYFVLDGLAVGLSVPGEWNFATGTSAIEADKRGKIGLKFAVTYFFDTDGGVFPYLGGNATPGYSLGENSFKLSGGVDAGVLVSLSESVALDFGLRPQIDFKLFDSDKWRLSIPAGFLGVKAVF
jgi:hypothetical protein